MCVSTWDTVSSEAADKYTVCHYRERGRGRERGREIEGERGQGDGGEREGSERDGRGRDDMERAAFRPTGRFLRELLASS